MLVAVIRHVTLSSGATIIVPMSTYSNGDSNVCQVETRRDRNAFVRLPWRIYEHDPAWVPPLLYERKRFIDRRKHPFYLYGDAALFVAQRNGEVVGRILAGDDPHYNQQHGTNAGTFGMFESIDDRQTAHALLDAAGRWLSDRRRDRVMGPIDYSTNYAAGLLIDGFEYPQRVMMNHNPPYYAHLLESWGLAKVRDLCCWQADRFTDDTIRWVDRAKSLLSQVSIEVRPVRRADWKAEMARCKAVYHEAWQDNWGFVRMTDAEFDHYARLLLRFGVEDLMLMAEVDGRPVGFSLLFPDINEAIRPLNGRLTRFGLPLGLLRLHRELKRIRTARYMILGAIPEYRRRGVTDLLLVRTIDAAIRLGFPAAEIGWVLEDNDRLYRQLERVGLHRHKTYRIYEKSL